MNLKLYYDRKSEVMYVLPLFSFLFFFYSFDNSDYQRNGDYFPTRLNVQKDGINLIGLTKVRSNPENNVGLLTYAR